MELRHLRYFVAVAEELHFGRAAERLCIAQPPLSIQIRQLETELGFRLFERTNRKVELTEPGRFFLEEARGLLASLHQSVDAGRRMARGESGWLGVGFVGSATYGLLPRILLSFHDQYPDVELVLRELVSAKQAQALLDGRIHVGLARPPVHAAGIESELLIREPMIAAVPSAHPMAGRSLDLKYLADEPFILFPRHPKPSYADSVFGACEQAGFTPNVVQETAEMHTAVALVAAGLGVTLVPESVSSEWRPGLSFCRLDSPAPVTELSAVYRAGTRVPALHSFLAVTRTAAHVV